MTPRQFIGGLLLIAAIVFLFFTPVIYNGYTKLTGVDVDKGANGLAVFIACLFAFAYGCGKQFVGLHKLKSA